MPTLPETIISAFKELGGELNITEIKEWINERYVKKWKDIDTSVADMVPISHGGNTSSRIHVKYRVLDKVSRGKYRLLSNQGEEAEVFGVTKSEKKLIKVTCSNERNQYIQGKDNCHYVINSANNMLEIFTSKRLPFEPTGWQLELRNQMRESLRLLKSDGTFFHALYKSRDQRFFDIENVLFYNIGASAFRHLNIKTLQFERSYEHPPITNRHQQFEHYQS